MKGEKCKMMTFKVFISIVMVKKYWAAIVDNSDNRVYQRYDRNKLYAEYRKNIYYCIVK